MEAEQRHITITSVNATSSKPTASAQRLPSIAGMVTSPSNQAGANEQKHFPFLELPAELRLLVYEHLLVASEPWRLAVFARNTSKLYPNVIATCKLVRQEATPVLYGSNEFEFNSALRRDSVARFLNGISDSVHHISAVTISLVAATRKDLKSILVLLKKCAALSKLTIGVGVWTSYKAGAFVKATGPLARLLHKNQQKKKDLKTRDVLDDLHFAAARMYNGPRRDVVALQARENERAATFEKEVKDLLRATFK